MLKKNKSKMKRRNTEPTMTLTGTATPHLSLMPVTVLASDSSTGDTDAENTPNNTDF